MGLVQSAQHSAGSNFEGTTEAYTFDGRHQCLVYAHNMVLMTSY